MRVELAFAATILLVGCEDFETSATAVGLIATGVPEESALHREGFTVRDAVRTGGQFFDVWADPAGQLFVAAGANFQPCEPNTEDGCTAVAQAWLDSRPQVSDGDGHDHSH